MAAQSSRFVEANGLRLHYVESGRADAPAVMLLHGLRGHAHSWDDVSDALAADYRVLALDQRGRGDSGWPKDGAYGMDAFVADIEGFRAALGLETFVLVGHSMGGRNGILYTSRNPQRVKALAVVDVGPDIQPEGAARIRKEIVDAPEAFDSLDAAVAQAKAENPLASEAVLRRRVQYQTKQGPDSKIVWRYDPVIRDQVRSNTRPPPPNIWPAWESITCPQLVLRGAETDTLARSTAERMTANRPNAKLAEIPRAGHMTFEDNPADFIKALRAWLGSLK